MLALSTPHNTIIYLPVPSYPTLPSHAFNNKLLSLSLYSTVSHSRYRETFSRVDLTLTFMPHIHATLVHDLRGNQTIRTNCNTRADGSYIIESLNHANH